MRKLVSLLAKMDQEDRNLILFLVGRVSKKQGGMQRGRPTPLPIEIDCSYVFCGQFRKSCPLEKTSRRRANNWQFLRTVTPKSEPITQAECANCGTDSIGTAIA